MSIKVAAWNVHNGFGGPKSAEVVELVKAMDVDAAVFPEAYSSNQNEQLHDSREALEKLGYATVSQDYEFLDERIGGQGIMAINRLGEDSIRHDVWLDVANGLRVSVRDPKTDIPLDLLGVHFDDRSEAGRLRQVDAILDLISMSEEPRLLAGDLNSSAASGRLIRAMARLAVKLPAVYPTAEKPSVSRIERVFNIAHRLGEMSGGQAVTVLQENGFVDADPSQRPTWPSRLPRLQLDHVMAKGDVRFSYFEVHGSTNISDHRAISVTLET